MKFFRFIILILSAFILFSCGKKSEDGKNDSNNVTGGEFKWTEKVNVNMIPDVTLKGKIDGKDISFEYVNFEVWRGSNDNVINFGDKPPKQKCGYVEGDNAFRLSKLGSDISEGEFVKQDFVQNLDNYTASFHISQGDKIKKFDVPWNCALVITDIDDEIVKGRIAMCFNDRNKSWLAGNFIAVKCNN